MLTCLAAGCTGNETDVMALQVHEPEPHIVRDLRWPAKCEWGMSADA